MEREDLDRPLHSEGGAYRELAEAASFVADLCLEGRVPDDVRDYVFLEAELNPFSEDNN